MELLRCCVGGAQSAFERIEEVDGLAKKSIDVVNNVIIKGNDMRQINETISPMLKERPNPATLVKVPGLCKDAADLTTGMKDLTKECCEHAAEISRKLKEVLDSRCSILVKFMGNNTNGKNEDDPEPANTEPDCIELRELKDAIVDGNAIAIIKEGSDCVEGIKQKVGVVETLCSALQKFAEAITTITANILALDVDKILSNVADISRMLQLSDMLGQFATEMLKLIECVSEVFHAVMEKIENAIPNLGEFAEIAGAAGDMLGQMGVTPEKMGNFIGKMF